MGQVQVGRQSIDLTGKIEDTMFLLNATCTCAKHALHRSDLGHVPIFDRLVETVCRIEHVGHARDLDR
eukprot:2542473-Prorocentrum_lima.AAC.1